MCKNTHKRAKKTLQKMLKCAIVLQNFAKMRKNTTKFFKKMQRARPFRLSSSALVPFDEIRKYKQ